MDWNVADWNALTAALEARDARALGRATDKLRAQGFKYNELRQHAASTLGMTSFEFENRMADADAAET